MDVRNDSILFTERKPVSAVQKTWTGVKAELRNYIMGKKFPRPDYSMNEKYGQVKRIWEYSSDANIISTPAVADGKVLVGNQNGQMTCFSIKDGKPLWKFKTAGAVFSSPAVTNGKIVFGSGDGNVYCLELKKGKLQWKYKAGASVLGSPVINGDTIFIGGSDQSFVALNSRNGKLIWKFSGLDGPVVSTALLYNGKVTVSYTHLRAHETVLDLVCRLLLEKKK